MKIDLITKVGDSAAANMRTTEARGDIVVDQEALVVMLTNQRDNATTSREVV
jgi:uncharacterized membrane-anchored protein